MVFLYYNNYSLEIIDKKIFNRLVTKSNNSPNGASRCGARPSPSLIVVIWLVDDASHGSAFHSYANQHRHVIE